MTRQEIQSKISNKKGFTLAETLIALAITVILLAISMVGIIHYIDKLKLTEMDNTAKQIFIAAQNHLSEADASGRLKKYKRADKYSRYDQSKLTESEKAEKEAYISDLGTKMQTQPADLPEEMNWPDNGASDTNSYYYIIYNPANPDSLKDTLLADMLPFGSIDEEIRSSGNYIIEYDIRTASVYGVFYTDSDEGFVADDNVGTFNNIAPSGARFDTNEGKSARMHYKRDNKKCIFGYYGGAMADVLIAAEIDEPVLKIKNGNRLVVEITDKNYFTKVGSQQIKTKVTLKVTGIESKKEKTFSLDLNGDALNPQKKDATKDKFWTVETKTDKTGKKKLVYTAVLDDITTKEFRFTNLFSAFYPGENIIVTATLSSDNALVGVEEHSKTTNSLFDSLTTDPDDSLGKKLVAGISSIRHLENLDSYISNMGRNSSNFNSRIVKASQTKDIDWNDFVDETGGEDKNFICRWDSGASLGKKTFFSIQRDVLEAYEGNNHTIRNIIIDNSDGKNFNTSFAAGCNTGIDAGLFRGRTSGAKFSVSNLTLENFDVKAYKNAAVLIAEINSGSLTVTVKNVLVKDCSIYSVDSDTGNAAGFIGYLTCSTATFSDCATSITAVSKKGRSSGFIGGTGGGTFKFNNCYSSGRTGNGKYQNYSVSEEYEEGYSIIGSSYAAGFVARVDSGSALIFNNCYSTCSVMTTGNTTSPDSGGIQDSSVAGGFIAGTCSSSVREITLTNCYVTGSVKNDNDPDHHHTGAFIGNIRNGQVSTKSSNVYYLDESNSPDLPFTGTGTSKYTNNANKTKVIQALSYDEMSAKGSDNVTSVSADEGLEDREYPFAPVNKTHVHEFSADKDGNETDVTKESDSYYHYGDWPLKNVVYTEKDRVFAYYEVINGKKYWYTLYAYIDEDGKVQTEINDTLKKSPSGKLESSGYGIVSTQSSIHSEFTQNGQNINRIVDVNNPVKETFGQNTYYFYKCKGTLPRNSDGTVTLSNWRFKEDNKETVTFTFNPDFGAAISTSATDKLGTEGNPYRIRNEEQLKNISGYSAYMDSIYKQDCNITLSGSDFKALGGTFNGTYNGAGHKISGLKQTVSGSDSSGLFTKLSKDAKLINLNLESCNITIKNDAETSNIGSFSGFCEGTLSGCSSDATITVNSDSAGSLNIGGLVGKLGTDGKIDGCSYSGSITVNGSEVSADSSTGLKSLALVKSKSDNTLKKSCSANIGGIAGVSNGRIIKASSTAEINVTAPENVGRIYAGGLLGKASNSRISQSYSNGTMTTSGEVLSASAIGYLSSKASIGNCYALTEYNPPDEGSTLEPALFVAERELSTDETQPDNISNCFAAQTLRNSNNSVVMTKAEFPFISNGMGVVNEDTNCYFYGDTDIMGAIAIDDSEKCKDISTFEGFSIELWEVVNDSYPTLKRNPEKHN